MEIDAAAILVTASALAEGPLERTRETLFGAALAAAVQTGSPPDEVADWLRDALGSLDAWDVVRRELTVRAMEQAMEQSLGGAPPS